MQVGIRPIAITPEGDKVTRMLAPSAKIEEKIDRGLGDSPEDT